MAWKPLEASRSREWGTPAPYQVAALPRVKAAAEESGWEEQGSDLLKHLEGLLRAPQLWAGRGGLAPVVPFVTTLTSFLAVPVNHSPFTSYQR